MTCILWIQFTWWPSQQKIEDNKALFYIINRYDTVTAEKESKIIPKLRTKFLQFNIVLTDMILWSHEIVWNHPKFLLKYQSIGILKLVGVWLAHTRPRCPAKVKSTTSTWDRILHNSPLRLTSRPHREAGSNSSESNPTLSAPSPCRLPHFRWQSRHNWNIERPHSCRLVSQLPLSPVHHKRSIMHTKVT